MDSLVFQAFLFVAFLHFGVSDLFYSSQQRLREQLNEISFFDSTKYPAEWFEQPLDHFNASNRHTWKQRYYVNWENAGSDTKNAPIFFYLGAEGESHGEWLGGGSNMMTNARHYKAIAIELEHRFYGQSKPTADMSLASLKYLSSRQALEDAANFISAFKRKHGLLQNKVIVFGGSYGGNLAAWFRIKYPHLVSGAIASSAPVQAVLNFSEFMKVVANSLGATCTANIRNAFNEMHQLLETPQGCQKISHLFKLCNTLDGKNAEDVSNLMFHFAGQIAVFVQYNDELSPIMDIQAICKVMENPSVSSPLQRFANLFSQIQKGCISNSYVNSVRSLAHDQWWSKDSSNSGRLWTFQTCNEFGYFQTSDDSIQPFGHNFPLSFFVQRCADIFGHQITRNILEKDIERTNNYYGGVHLQGSSNILFPNGQIDPWHALGILHPIGDTVQPLLIPGAAHCADMLTRETPTIKKAHEVIHHTIGEFLKH